RLLWCELIERVHRPLACLLAGRLEFDARAFCEGLHPEVGEELVGGSELPPRVDPPDLPPEPLSVYQVRTGQIEPKPGGLESVDGFRIAPSAATPSARRARDLASTP